MSIERYSRFLTTGADGMITKWRSRHLAAVNDAAAVQAAETINRGKLRFIESEIRNGESLKAFDDARTLVNRARESDNDPLIAQINARILQTWLRATEEALRDGNTRF